MKSKIILTGIALATVFIFSCNNEAKKETEGTEKTTQSGTVAAYNCPMHPEVKSDKPGQCPQCGMELEAVEKKDSVKH